MTQNGESDSLLAAVPLFPLPNVVLFPRAVLPLHIFEERYKVMTADALEGDRRIAMALLKPGWEKDYYSRPAIEPVVCVGTIVSSERLPDGKYNFLLQGTHRARILREHAGRPYRTADLQVLAETPVLEIDLSDERRRLVELFSSDPLRAAPITRQFARLLDSPAPTSDIVDLVAFNLLEEIPLKQSLLAEADVRRRVRRTVEAIDRLRPLLEASAAHRGDDPSPN